MNMTSLKQLEETLRYSGTAIARAQMLFKDKLTDPGYDILRRLSQAQSDMESYVSGHVQIESHNCAESRLSDLRSWLKCNPDATDTSIVKSLKAHMEGYNG